jgi:hypothetical protein
VATVKLTVVAVVIRLIVERVDDGSNVVLKFRLVRC